jgi:hypothetical protein
MYFYNIALLLLLPLSTLVRTAEVYFVNRFPFSANLCLGLSCSRRTFHVALKPVLYRA